MAVDLSWPQGPYSLFDDVQHSGTQIDVLVNNAGYGKFGEFAKMPLEDDIGMIQLNMVTLTVLSKLFLGPMLERRYGKIMNVASTAGFQPGPMMAVYYATKAYVISLSEAIANELKGSGVTVTCLCPGATATRFASRAKMEESRLFKLGAMKSKDVARAGYKGMMAGKGMVVPGVLNKTIAMSVRFSPRKMVTAISRSLQERGK